MGLTSVFNHPGQLALGVGLLAQAGLRTACVGRALPFEATRVGVPTAPLPGRVNAHVH